jgi:alpha-D-ribose 1-methylphosphonate 5-triphosphate synthase subunit PhnG
MTYLGFARASGRRQTPSKLLAIAEATSQEINHLDGAAVLLSELETRQRNDGTGFLPGVRPTAKR